MKSRNLALLSLSCAMGLVTTASAGNVSVSASAGSVAGIDTTGTSSSNGSGIDWSGLTGSAMTAVIYYQTDPTLAEEGDLSGASSEFKCIDNEGNFAAHTFNGVSANGSSVVGASSFSDPANGAPEYYQASWTASSTSFDPKTGSGTYDPWIVTAGDIMKLGTSVGGTANLYYQTSLLGGFSNATGFNLTAGQTGSYNYRVGVAEGGAQKNFLDFTVNRTGNAVASFTAAYTAYSGFDLYLLGTNAHDDGSDPYARVGAGTLVTSTAQLGRILSNDLRSDGSLRYTLDFGLVDRGQILTTNDPNAPILAWNSTTLQTVVQPTPEPTPMAALAVGVLAVHRRRRRSLLIPGNS